MFTKIGAVVRTIVASLASVWLKDRNVAARVIVCFGMEASTFGPVLILSVWCKGMTKEGIITGLVVGPVVSLVFTFADVPDVKGMRVLGNPVL